MVILSKKYIFWNFNFLQENVINSQNCFKFRQIGRRPPFVQKSHIVEPKIYELAILWNKMGPYLIGLSAGNLQIGSFWANWKNPLLSNGPQYGAQKT